MPLDDRMPERAQEIRCRVERGAYVVRQPAAGPGGKVVRNGDAQVPLRLLCGFHEALLLGAEDVEHQAGVQHRAGQRTEHHPMATVAIMRSAGDPITLRL